MRISGMTTPELVSHIGVLDGMIQRLVGLSDGLRAALSYELIDKDSSKVDYDKIYSAYKDYNDLRGRLLKEYNKRFVGSFKAKSITSSEKMIADLVEKYPQVNMSASMMEAMRDDQIRAKKEDKKETTVKTLDT